MFRSNRSPVGRSGTGALAAVLVFAALSARAEEPAVQPPNAARILPDSTLALFVAEDITLTKETYRETSLWRLWEEQEVQTFFEPIIPKLEEIIGRGEEMGGFRFADISAAFGGQVAVAFLGFDTAVFPPLPEIALIADVTDREAASRLLERAGRAVNEGTPAEYRTWQAGPVTFGRISQAGERMELGYVLTESALYVALGPEGNALKALVDAARDGQERPLAADGDFLEAVERAGGRRDFFSYLQVRKIRELFFTLAPRMGGRENELDNFRRVLDVLGVSDVRSVSFVEAVDPPGFRSQMFVHAPSPRKGLFDLVLREALRDSMLKLAPANSKSLLAFRLRMDRYLSLVRDVINIVEPGVVEQVVDPGLEQFKESIGIDIEHGVLEGLGLEGQLVSTPVATAGAGPAAGMGGLVLIMRASDPEAFMPVYDVVLALLQGLAEARQFTVTDSTTPDGAVVTSFGIPMLKPNGIVPAITMTKRHLVIGLSAEAVERVCRGISGILPEPLVEADDYRRALARVGAEPGFLLSFGRPMSKEEIDQLAPYLGMLSPFLASAAAQPDVPPEMAGLIRAIDLTRLPSGSTFARHGLAQMTVGWQDDDGLGFTSFGPVGLSAASAAVAGGLTAAVIPQIARRRAGGERRACEAHLKQIGLALQLYANDNDGSYPAKLGDLVPDYLGDPAILACPAGGGYSYVSGLKEGDRRNVIVAFDSPENHRGGANVVRVDGTVIWQRNPQWVTRMVDMQVKRFERQGRAVRVIGPGGGAGGDGGGGDPEEFF